MFFCFDWTGNCLTQIDWSWSEPEQEPKRGFAGIKTLLLALANLSSDGSSNALGKCFEST